MELRGYQKDLINQLRRSFIDHKRTLCVLPCGAGKTVMFAYMANKHLQTYHNGYVWFLVHRQELIDQTIRTFDEHNIDRTKILIGMIQSVSRHLDKYNKPSLIIFDEAHHATANTWLHIINKYNNVPVVGLTATPCRMDGSSLGSIFDDMQIGVSPKWLINNKYLSEYDYYAPNINFDESTWIIKGKDYDMNSVAESLSDNKIYGDILKYINLNHKTIVYAPNIAYSNNLSQIINTHFKSVVCAHFDGNTPTQERKSIINKFRNGELRILTNVDLIGEGFDVPDCDSVILLRPTMSTALYIQQSMRCLRPSINKRAIIYDLVGNVYKHGLPIEDREWSLNKSVKVKNTTNDKELIVRTCKHCLRVYEGNNRICPYCHSDNGKTKKQIEEEKQIELEKITELKKKQERMEVGMARNLDQLISIGRKRGYKNPIYWANMVYKSRKKI